MYRLVPSLLIALSVLPQSLAGQSGPEAFVGEIMGHFETSTSKVAMLADAMPAESYDWSPGEGVMTVGRVYRHIAHYNFMYLRDNLGVPAPSDIDVDGIEELSGKEVTTEVLRRSIEHVRQSVAAMSGETVSGETELYGRTVEGWAVLLQLVAHMNEHLGQSIAYARSNGVVPPWSS